MYWSTVTVIEPVVLRVMALGRAVQTDEGEDPSPRAAHEPEELIQTLIDAGIVDAQGDVLPPYCDEPTPGLGPPPLPR